MKRIDASQTRTQKRCITFGVAKSAISQIDVAENKAAQDKENINARVAGCNYRDMLQRVIEDDPHRSDAA